MGRASATVSLKVALVGQDKISAALETAKQNTEQFSNSAKKNLKSTSGAFASITGSIEGLGNKWTEINSFIGVAQTGLSMLGTAIDELADVDRRANVALMFNRMVEAPGLALANLRHFSHGMGATDTELQQLGLSANQAGFNIEQMGQLMEIASKKSIYRGQDLKSSFEEVLASFKGLSSESLLLLGIEMDVEKRRTQMVAEAAKSGYMLSTMEANARLVGEALEEVANNTPLAEINLADFNTTAAQTAKDLEHLKEEMTSTLAGFFTGVGYGEDAAKNAADTISLFVSDAPGSYQAGVDILDQMAAFADKTPEAAAAFEDLSKWMGEYTKWIGERKKSEMDEWLADPETIKTLNMYTYSGNLAGKAAFKWNKEREIASASFIGEKEQYSKRGIMLRKLTALQSGANIEITNANILRQQAAVDQKALDTVLGGGVDQLTVYTHAISAVTTELEENLLAEKELKHFKEMGRALGVTPEEVEEELGKDPTAVQPLGELQRKELEDLSEHLANKKQMTESHEDNRIQIMLGAQTVANLNLKKSLLVDKTEIANIENQIKQTETLIAELSGKFAMFGALQFDMIDATNAANEAAHQKNLKAIRKEKAAKAAQYRSEINALKTTKEKFFTQDQIWRLEESGANSARARLEIEQEGERTAWNIANAKKLQRLQDREEHKMSTKQRLERDNLEDQLREMNRKQSRATAVLDRSEEARGAAHAMEMATVISEHRMLTAAEGMDEIKQARQAYTRELWILSNDHAANMAAIDTAEAEHKIGTIEATEQRELEVENNKLERSRILSDARMEIMDLEHQHRSELLTEWGEGLQGVADPLGQIIGLDEDASAGMEALAASFAVASAATSHMAGAGQDYKKAVPGMMSASASAAASMIEDTKSQAIVQGAFEVGASLSSFAFGDIKGGAMHAASAAAFFALAGSGKKGGAGGSGGALSSGGGGTSGGGGGPGSTTSNLVLNVSGFVGSEHDLAVGMSKSLSVIGQDNPGTGIGSSLS